MSPAEKRRLMQLMICGTVFILLVGVKLFLPGKMASIQKTVNDVMSRNMDVAQVFSTVGKAFSGQQKVGDSLSDVYQAVFHPEAAAEAAATVQKEGETAAAMEPLRAFAAGRGSGSGWLPASREEGAESGSEAGAESPAAEATPPAPAESALSEEPARNMELSYVLYSGENLPDNVSMEQTVLGFDYCTPVCGALSSGFGYREHPVEGEEKFHYGVDIAADTGTDIRCFADGTVTAVGESTSYGKYVIVAHGDGYSTLYAHCSAVTARSGAAVSEGDKIAEVGETGMATGPHLHFELHEEDTYLNPIYYVSLV